jgi:hypothetical protein
MTDPTGAYEVSYTPTSTGTYTFSLSFPGELVYNVTTGGMNGAPKTIYTAYFEPEKASVTDTVTTTQVTGYTEAPVPLPNQYWTQPINEQNRYWNAISGPWLMSTYNGTSKFNPYSYAPTSAHILWKEQLAPEYGGIVGGDYGSEGYSASNAVAPISSPVIMSGYLYCNGPASESGTSQFYCIQLSTGKIMWTQSGSITCGQLLNWRSQQIKAVYPYLWSISGTTWKMYSAQTGALLVSFTNAFLPAYNNYSPAIMLSPVYSDVTAGSGSGNLANYAGSSGGGTLLVYETALNAYDNATLLTCWNSTQAVLSYTIGPGQPQGNVVTWTLPAAGSSINWANGVQWNVSIPVVSSLYTSGLSQTSLATIPGNKAGSQFIIGPLYIATIGQTLILGRMSYLQAEDTNVTELPVVAVDANTGAVLWNMYIPVSAYEEAASSPTYYVGGTDNVFLWYVSDYMQWQAYSVSTGKELWTCTPEENDYATQSIGAVAFAYGNL